MDFVTIIAITAFIISITSLVWVYIIHRHYQSLTRGASKKDLMSALNHLIQNAKSNTDNIDMLSTRLSDIANQARSYYQHIGFERYNPFTDTGGDQSFSLCLLDDHGNGIIITSLHSRENTRVYAKDLKSWQSVGPVLSKEEAKIIKNLNKNA
jgi:hypothetical protein